MNITIIFFTLVFLAVISLIIFIAFSEKVKKGSIIPKKNYTLFGVYIAITAFVLIVGVWNNNVADNGTTLCHEQKKEECLFDEASLEFQENTICFRAEPNGDLTEFPSKLVEFKQASTEQDPVAKIIKTRPVRGVKIFGIWFYSKGSYEVTTVTLYTH